jgi:hypothetical protein
LQFLFVNQEYLVNMIHEIMLIKLPDTRRCTNCARSQEAKGNPEFDLLVSQSQLGKVGSLKKNYGDVTVQKRRRKFGE